MVRPINDRFTTAERRTIVAQNLKAGMHYREIAAGLGVSLTTVAKDVKIILAQWRDENVVALRDKIAIDEQRIEAIINANWTKTLDGNSKAAEVVLRAMEHRAKLLGLNAPELHAVAAYDWRSELTAGAPTAEEIKEALRQTFINAEQRAAAPPALVEGTYADDRPADADQ